MRTLGWVWRAILGEVRKLLNEFLPDGGSDAGRLPERTCFKDGDAVGSDRGRTGNGACCIEGDAEGSKRSLDCCGEKLRILRTGGAGGGLVGADCSSKRSISSKLCCVDVVAPIWFCR